MEDLRYTHQHRLTSDVKSWARSTLYARLETDHDELLLIATTGEIPYILALLDRSGWDYRAEDICKFPDFQLVIRWVISITADEQFHLILDDLQRAIEILGA